MCILRGITPVMKLLIISLVIPIVISFQVSARELEVHEIEYEWQQKFSKKKIKDALDYFYLLPSVFINCEGASFNAYDSFEKRKNIEPRVSDDRAYLGFYRVAEIAIFRRKSGADIIAIQSGRCGAGNTCGAINSTFTFEEGIWKETPEVIPMSITDILNAPADEVCPYIDLSKKENGIVLMDSWAEKPMKDAGWNGEIFVEEK